MKIISPILKEQDFSSLDLNELMIKHPAATFFVRAEGDEMVGCGILSGDILVVDRSITPVSKKIVIAIWRGEFLVRTLNIMDNKIFLQKGNGMQDRVDNSDFEIWGVVTHIIHECH